MCSPGTETPDGRDPGMSGWSRVRFDIVLAPAGSKGSTAPVSGTAPAGGAGPAAES